MRTTTLFISATLALAQGCSEPTTAQSSSVSALLVAPVASFDRTTALDVALRRLCVSGDACDVNVDLQRGTVTLDVRDTPDEYPWRAAPDDKGAALAILGALGVPTSEAILSADTFLKATDDDEGQRTDRVVERKSFFERRVDNYRVAAHRAVVSRDLDGKFTGAFIFWPTLQSASDGLSPTTFTVAEETRDVWGDRFVGEDVVLVSWKGRTSIALELRRQTQGPSGPSFLERHYFAHGEEIR